MSAVNTPVKQKHRNWTPVLIGSGIAVGVLGAGAWWVLGKKKFADNVVITQTIKVEVIEKRNYFGVTIPLKFNLVAIAKVKNPTNASATLMQPYVEIRLKEDDEAPFASSNISSKVFKVESNSEETFDPIIIPINTNDILSKAFSIMKSAIKARSLALYSRTITNLVTKAGKLPVEENEKTELKF